MFEEEQDWTIELYEKINRVWTHRETLLKFTASMEEAYEMMGEFSTAYPPNVIVAFASELEQHNNFELRLVNSKGYQSVVICWERETIKQCVEHYNSLNRKTVQVIVELELLEEDGDDPDWWDWNALASTGRVEVVSVLDQDESVCTSDLDVLEFVETPREEC